VINPIREISLSLAVLRKADQKKFKLILLVQACLGFLDLFGVAVLGVVGSLAIRGVQSAPAGNRVSQILEWFNILTFSLQSQVAILGIIAVLVLVLKTIASVILTRRILRFLSRKSYETSAELVKRIFLIPELGIKARTSHELQYAIGPGVSALCIGVLGSASTLVSDFSLLVILAIGLLIYDPVTATTVTLIFSLVGIALYLLMFRRARRISAKIVKYNILSNKTLLEAIQTYREIYVRNRREFYISRIARMKEEISTSIAEQAFMPNISKYVIEITLVVGALTLSAILFITQDASHAVAGLALFIASGSRIGPALLRLQQSLVQIQSSYAEAEPSITLIKSLHTEMLPEYCLDVEAEKPFVGEVVISNLNFSYPDSEEPTLSDINLVIPSGSTLAIVGPSGSGKSTLVDLLLGVHLPDSGSVLISSQSPRRAIANWPGKIAYVPQDVRIVEGSISENIALGYDQTEIVDSRIQKSVEISQLSSLVNELAQGVYSQVGEFGTKLSGGQRQRIGIARALYTDPELLVLDEATSSLDGQTESEVSTAINNIKGTVTTIVVAHRLSTVKDSDQIIYLEAGKIRASGNFEQIRSQVADFDTQANLMGL
jgi:ABC-type multidrug transport system fused ATPase/permease subunit